MKTKRGIGATQYESGNEVLLSIDHANGTDLPTAEESRDLAATLIRAAEDIKKDPKPLSEQYPVGEDDYELN